MNRRSFVKLFGAFLGALPIANRLQFGDKQEEVVEDMWEGELAKRFWAFCQTDSTQNFKTLEEKRLACLAGYFVHASPVGAIYGFVHRLLRPHHISDEEGYKEHPLDPELVQEALSWLENAYRDWPQFQKKLWDWRREMLIMYGNEETKTLALKGQR